MKSKTVRRGQEAYCPLHQAWHHFAHFTILIGRTLFRLCKVIFIQSNEYTVNPRNVLLRSGTLRPQVTEISGNLNFQPLTTPLFESSHVQTQSVVHHIHNHVQTQPNPRQLSQEQPEAFEANPNTIPNTQIPYRRDSCASSSKDGTPTRWLFQPGRFLV